MLGNRRFLIIFISVLSAMALVFLGAVAEELPAEINVSSFEGEKSALDAIIRDVALDSVSSDPFNFLEQSYYAYYGYSRGSLPNTHTISIYTVSVYDGNGNFVIGSSGSLAEFMVSGLGYFYDGVFVTIPGMTYSNFDSFTFDITSPSSSLVLRYGVVADGDLVVASPLTDFWDTISGVGNSIISFVMSSWVVLVPVVAFVLILGIGVVRRFVKGV